MESLLSGMWLDKFCGQYMSITVIFRPIPKMIRYLDSLNQFDSSSRISSQIFLIIFQNFNILTYLSL